SRLQLIPAILATAIDTPEEKIRAYEAGADDFLVKPINRADLSVRLRSLLRIYQFNQELVGAEGVALTLARAVAVKDGYSQAHIGMVAHYSVMLGEKMNMDVAELKTLKYGAILHNVGKISIPDYILEKQDPLTPREMALIHQHPEIGCEICSPLKPLRPVLSIIRHHKERWDGNGYPDRLKGDAIPLGAQIVGLVDAYTALISDRPYRRAMSHDEAIGLLRRQAAEGRYNPALLDRLMECFDNAPIVMDEDESKATVAEEVAV
ncbi:MAG: HD domain-containing protein, partial [Pirellulaceae bacterium]|nr:HD domain-containing protein [Pirellulaceae bacterium]